LKLTSTLSHGSLLRPLSITSEKEEEFGSDKRTSVIIKIHKIANLANTKNIFSPTVNIFLKNNCNSNIQ